MQAKILKESIVDPVQEEANPYVWKDSKINPLIKIRIVEILDELKIIFREVAIIGSITSKRWSESSDIDCAVFVNETTLSNYRKIARVVNERNFFGSFPINLYFRTNTIEDMKNLSLSSGIFNLLQNKWEKEPTESDDLEEILKNPKKLAERIAAKLDGDLDQIAELTQNLLNDYNNPSVNFDEKLNLLNLEIDDYVKTLNELRKRRIDEYSKVLEGDDLEKVKRLGSRNILPWEIIFKYLTKWLYFRWSAIFKSTIKNDELKKSELKELFQNFVRYWI